VRRGEAKGGDGEGADMTGTGVQAWAGRER
jgi:hypothetical protein